MRVYTRKNGKRVEVLGPRDLMNLRGEGTVFVQDNSNGADAATWAVAVLYHVRAGGKVVGEKGQS